MSNGIPLRCCSLRRIPSDRNLRFPCKQVPAHLLLQSILEIETKKAAAVQTVSFSGIINKPRGSLLFLSVYSCERRNKVTLSMT